MLAEFGRISSSLRCSARCVCRAWYIWKVELINKTTFLSQKIYVLLISSTFRYIYIYVFSVLQCSIRRSRAWNMLRLGKKTERLYFHPYMPVSWCNCYAVTFCFCGGIKTRANYYLYYLYHYYYHYCYHYNHHSN